MTARFTAILLPFFFSFFVMHSAAQSSVFQWSFDDMGGSTNLLECASLGLAIQPSSSAKPPYYMISYEVGGTTTVSPVGTDGAHLGWQVNHRAGSALLLSLVDSVGNGGSVSSSTWAVKDGDSTSCLPPLPASFPVITANVTSNLNTCQPLGLAMQGGAPPYTVSIASPGGVVTNLTLSPEDDIFTYISRASPNSDLLVSVSDSLGNWAAKSVVINTVGPSDAQCPGLASSSGRSTPQPSGVSATGAPSHHRVALIVGVCLGVAVIILIAGLYLLWLILHQRSRRLMDGQDVTPRSWPGESTLISSRFTKMEIVKNHPSLSIDLTDSDSMTMAGSGSPQSPHKPTRSVASPTPTSDGVLDISPGNRPPSPAFAPNPELQRHPPSATPFGVLDISPANRPVSPVFAPNPDIQRYVPSPSPSTFRRPLPRISSLERHAPSTPPSATLRLATDTQYYAPFHGTPTTPFRPLPTPPSTPRSQKSQEADVEAQRWHAPEPRHLRSARSAGEFRRTPSQAHHLPGLARHRHNSLSRSRSLMHIRPNDVVIQHHDRNSVIHDLPPPYHECLQSSSPLRPRE